MRLRAVALVVVAGLSVAAPASAIEVEDLFQSPFLAAISQPEPPSSPPEILPIAVVVPDPDPNLPIVRWFGCTPPYDGICVRDPYAEKPPAELVPDQVESVEDWRPLVEAFFEPGEVDRALRVIRCESGGDAVAKNPNSSASGLFQHLGSLWGDRTVKSGNGGADIFDPVSNVAVAAWLVYEGGGWSHWNPSRHCWG